MFQPGKTCPIARIIALFVGLVTEGIGERVDELNPADKHTRRKWASDTLIVLSEN